MSFQTYVTTLFHMCIVIIPLCLGMSIMNANINSALTNAVQHNDTGKLISLVLNLLRIEFY